MIRSAPEYRADAFRRGLNRAGYLWTERPFAPEPGDVLVIWNRYGRFADAARRFEAAGAAVIVVENGYHDAARRGWHDRHAYAMALSSAKGMGHNGSGRWPGNGVPYPQGLDPLDRVDGLHIQTQPWRTHGKHILVCGQRAIGEPPMQSPPDWAAGVCRRLRGLTARPIRLRAHPGNADPALPLSYDLAECWAVVVWSSNSATAALIAGIPVFYEAPHIVTQRACHKGIGRIETPEFPDRVPALVDLAWAQWSVGEIADGVPFRVLLQGVAGASAPPPRPSPHGHSIGGEGRVGV
jgi:hypothetical protein